ncbi:transposase [Agromyces italicus]|uniref:transposase n=1 Tax=Agromyces italicus TaxID=279572 RepID=UPI003D15FF16
MPKVGRRWSRGSSARSSPQPEQEHVATQLADVVRMLARAHTKAAQMLEGARDDLLAFATFPTRHWRQIWSTNPGTRERGGTAPTGTSCVYGRRSTARKRFDLQQF